MRTKRTTTYTSVEVSKMIGVPYRTLMSWIEERLINPACQEGGERRKKIRFAPKDVREASILAGLRANRLSMQQLRESLDYLRSIGHNPMSTGDFLVIKGRDGKPKDLLKFCTSGEVLDIMKGRYGPLVMSVWKPEEEAD